MRHIPGNSTEQRGAGFSVRNSILADLSSDDLRILRPHLKRVEIKARSVLQEANRRIEFVHFIEHGLVSRISGGRACSIETAMVGRFGFTGVAVALGAHHSTQRAVVRLTGTALRIQADQLSRLLEDRPHIRTKMLRYVASLMTQNAQGMLCVAKHDVGQRLARWLLLADDRMQSDTLMLTHEVLARVLGVRRASITETLSELEAKGALKKARGAVRLTNRAALEGCACGCYGIVRDAYAWSRTREYDNPLPDVEHGRPRFRTEIVVPASRSRRETDQGERAD